MTPDAAAKTLFFTSYTGLKLPLRLIGPLDPDNMDNRNTFLRAYFDETDRLIGFDKLVYGDIHMSHRYVYHPSGALKQAQIIVPGDDLSDIWFDEQGQRISEEHTSLDL